MKIHSLGFVLGSMLLMLSLFLPLMWNFIDKDVIWCFPYFDAVLKDFSLNPTEYRCYPLRDVLPFYFYPFQVCIYLVCFRLLKNFNLWGFHLVYFAIQSVDLMLCFSQLPYYRTFFIVVGCALQLNWLFTKE